MSYNALISASDPWLYFSVEYATKRYSGIGSSPCSFSQSGTLRTLTPSFSELVGSRRKHKCRGFKWRFDVTTEYIEDWGVKRLRNRVVGLPPQN